MTDNQVYAICAAVVAVAFIGLIGYLIHKDFEK